ncbi:MAG TPA: hypothetical protein EYQ42_11600 [Thiotrichaceae bacterium]|nr:hypothetical protein [Thiotrichaceae bacterium]HIM08202.1 hypothetical protein [Gammaproteobacteria bacterium]
MKITVNKIIDIQQYVTLYLSVLMIVYSTAVFSQEEDNEVSIIDDIYTALTLQGIDCDGISEIEQNEDDSYDVVCESGGQFIISQTKNGILSVVDQITGVIRKGIEIFIDVIPMTDQLFQQSDEISEHDAEVARSLFSIIELSGNTCESITAVVSDIDGGHVVSCARNNNYRIFTGEDGLVEIEAIISE